jgi:hypothetical protein
MVRPRPGTGELTAGRGSRQSSQRAGAPRGRRCRTDVQPPARAPSSAWVPAPVSQGATRRWRGRGGRRWQAVRTDGSGSSRQSRNASACSASPRQPGRVRRRRGPVAPRRRTAAPARRPRSQLVGAPRPWRTSRAPATSRRTARHHGRLRLRTVGVQQGAGGPDPRPVHEVEVLRDHRHRAAAADPVELRSVGIGPVAAAQEVDAPVDDSVRTDELDQHGDPVHRPGGQLGRRRRTHRRTGQVISSSFSRTA